MRFHIIPGIFLTLHKISTKATSTRVLWVPAHVGRGGNEAANFGKTDGKWQPAQLEVTLRNQSKHNESEYLMSSTAVVSLSVLENPAGRNRDKGPHPVNMPYVSFSA